MAQVEITANPLSPPEKFANLVIDREKALDEVAVLLMSEAQAAFRNQGWRGGTPWKPRRVPNVAGLVLDLQETGEVKDRRLDANQTGVDTGRLRGDFDTRVDVEDGSVTLSNYTHYASDFHEGGASGPFPGAKKPGPIRRGLYKFLKQRPEFKPALGWLFGVEEWSYKEVPARPLVEFPDDVARDVRRIVLSHRLGAEED